METSQRFKKFLVFLFPALLLLTACEVEGIMEIKPGGKVAMEMHLADDTGMMQQMGLSCQGLTEQAGIDTAINDENGTLTVKDNSADGELDCLITANSSHPIIDGKNLVETDDTYIFYLNGDKTSFVDEDQLGLLGLVDFDFSFTVKMPGKIISADGAEISGNTARFTKFTALLKGVKVEGLKSPDKTAGAAPDNGSALGFKSGPDNQGTGSTILHTIAVTAIAILVLAAALIIFLMLRNKRKKDKKTSGGSPYSADNSYFAPYGGAHGNPHSNPYGDYYGSAPKNDMPNGSPNNSEYSANSYSGNAFQQNNKYDHAQTSGYQPQHPQTAWQSQGSFPPAPQQRSAGEFFSAPSTGTPFTPPRKSDTAPAAPPDSDNPEADMK